MQSSDILDESPIVKELSNVASQAFHELEITKQRLKYNARIDRALLRIIHLVNDVLGFVRITDLDLNETSVRSLIHSAIDSIDVPKQIEIIKPTDDFKINCDFRKLEAVFANL